jgi:hypothetical protein
LIASLNPSSIRISSQPVGVLFVSILSANNLVHSDTFSPNDAKATVEVLVEHRVTKVDTSHTPVWWEAHAPSDRAEKFQFSFAAREVDKLEIKVWDQDAFSADDILGKASIPVSEIALHGEAGLKIEKKSLRVPDEFSKNTQVRVVVVRPRFPVVLGDSVPFSLSLSVSLALSRSLSRARPLPFSLWSRIGTCGVLVVLLVCNIHLPRSRYASSNASAATRGDAVPHARQLRTSCSNEGLTFHCDKMR